MDRYAHRKGTATVHIKEKDGTPLLNKEVLVTQLSSKEMYGCAGFDTIQVVNNDLQGEEKKIAETKVEKMMEIFNFITLPFYWGRFEPVRGETQSLRTKKAADWLRDKGLAVKGHPLCWHTVCADWLLEFSDEEILRLQLERVKRDVTDFAGAIDIWDVINEVVIMPIFDRYDNAVTRICKSEGQVGLVKKLFDEARTANPNATLLINDFDMSTDYSDLVTKLLDAGVCIDAIGLQSHMHQGIWSEEKTKEVLDRFSKFGLPLHFTEINIVSGDLMPPHIVDLNDFVPDEWPTTPDGEYRQAEEVKTFYRWLFDCPLVEAFTYWSFSDGGWLNSPSGLVGKDGRVKPAYEDLKNLIHKEWRTPEHTLKSNDSGYINVSGYKGNYKACYDGLEVLFEVK